MLSQETYNSLFEYRDGMLFWKVNIHCHPKMGMRAGTKGQHYRCVSVNGNRYPEHRIIWVMFNGDIPDGLGIDHIDTNKRNNRIENLRLATKSQNQFNSGKPKGNKSGYKGVSRVDGKYWRSQISVSNKIKYLGIFKTPELAHEAYKNAATELHGQFANFG